jgi:FlaA1/EpsC-like NDP-sugar epimerase
VVARPWQLPNALRWVQRALDLVVLAAAYHAAFLLRFEGSIPANEVNSLRYSLPFVLLIQYAGLMGCRVPGLSWQYVSLLEVRRIVAGLALANTLLVLAACTTDLPAGLLPTSHLEMPPRGVLLIDLLVAAAGVVGLRVGVRLWMEGAARRQRGRPDLAVPTLLLGAGSAGAAVAREVVGHPHLGIVPLGFLDDDPKKQGLVIHGVPVLGAVADVAKVAQVSAARQALITIGNPSGENIRRILDLCKRCGLPTKIIPGLCHILSARVNLSAMREVALEDLLHREPVELDSDAIAGFVNSRTVLVSGAGGSIGSELCRLVARFGPARLVLVEHTENNLFHIHRELMRDAPAIPFVPLMADICDRPRMEQVFANYRPEVVLHAAAYKHVPMMEYNPGEAIKNNVLGTRMLADLAHASGVGEFVLISTDKAVNPTSIMGVSKRIAEMYVQALHQRSRTRFVTVRFGNVLGSAGSVVPIFKEQLARGGPITVTHPDMKRYFMTIPEACQLVLQAATMGEGGEIFILDMGEPVKIVDLARDLIRLSGLSPADVEIRFTGLRPGEKLFEELTLHDEAAQATRHPKIFIGRLRPCDWTECNRAIDELQLLADGADTAKLLQKLKALVPEFKGEELLARGPAAPARSDREHEAARPRRLGARPLAHLHLPRNGTSAARPHP